MQFYQSKLLKRFPKVTHAFTTKQTGNLAFHVDDDPDTLIKNHQQLAQSLHYDLKTLVHMKQIHSDIVTIVKDDANFKNPPICDALITDKKDIPLMVMVADCSPILFYDPLKEIIAVAHAGRAGAFNNIVAKVVKSFQENFQSNPHDIIAVIGPAICQNCYEVGEEIAKEAVQKRLEYALNQKETKYYLDIRSILHKELREAGILEKNIEISDICSRCHKDFFSYREDKTCGRFAGIIKLH
jgi:YfiH family protein